MNRLFLNPNLNNYIHHMLLNQIFDWEKSKFLDIISKQLYYLSDFIF